MFRKLSLLLGLLAGTLIAVSGLTAQSASAETLTAARAGHYTASGSYNWSGDVITGANAGESYRSYAAYAIPAGETIVSATLRVNTDIVNGGPNNLAINSLPDGVTPAQLGTANPSVSALYAALLAGAQIGQADGVVSWQTVDIPLNSTAIAALNAARGSEFGVGMINTTIEVANDSIMTAGPTLPVLILTRADPVPTLSEWAMIGMIGALALGGAAYMTYRRQRIFA